MTVGIGLLTDLRTNVSSAKDCELMLNLNAMSAVYKRNNKGPLITDGSTLLDRSTGYKHPMKDI